MLTTTTRTTLFPGRTISRKRSAARPSTIHPTADSSGRFANAWITGRSCARNEADEGYPAGGDRYGVLGRPGPGGRALGRPLVDRSVRLHKLRRHVEHFAADRHRYEPALVRELVPGW